MERMTDVKNPSVLSDYDWLEFVSFAWKVEREGYSYAVDNYGPKFENDDLPDGGPELKALYREHKPKVREWWDTVGGQAACDLVNAHVHESDKRADDACLWGIRCTDGYIIHCRSEAERSRTASELKEWFDKGSQGRRVPAGLLHREVPGAPWTETEMAA